MLPEVLPTVDPELGGLVRAELPAHGVEVTTSTTVTRISRAPAGERPAASRSTAPAATASPTSVKWTWSWSRSGSAPTPTCWSRPAPRPGPRGAIAVDEHMRTGLPDVYAAGDCVVTHHRLLGVTYLPLGTTAHKQGRVAGENAVGGHAHFAGSLGTQVVKVFDLVAARTGLREHEAIPAGYTPATTQSSPDDHKAYYPTAHPITIRITGDTSTGRLLGAQLVGRRGTEIAKRVDIYATAIYHDMTVNALNELDLSYTPPLGSPWDAVQTSRSQALDRPGSLGRRGGRVGRIPPEPVAPCTPGKET